MNSRKIAIMEEKVVDEHANITGIIVLQHDKTVYEQYFQGCDASTSVHVYSVTKSILSLLIGIAIDHGYIASIDQKILDFFPDYKIKKSEHTIQHITIKDILTMTAPYKYKIPPYIKYFTSNDWITFSLDRLGGRGTIGKFRYTPLIGPDILSGILVRATGQSVLDFANQHVFTPLGICEKNKIVFQSKEEQLAFNHATDVHGWVMDTTGTNSAGWGLTLSTLDMARIGQLYLNEGLWNDKQIVSSHWIKDSIQEHSRWKKANLAYGYLWWVIDTHSFAAMGDGGNVIYVNKQLDIVISISAQFKQNVTDRIEFIKAYIEPLVADVSS